jgi:hypothetical protein
MYTELRVESFNSLDFCSLLSGGFAVFVLLAMNSPNIIVPLNSYSNCVNDASLADFEIIGDFFRILISTRHYPAHTVKQYGIEFPHRAEMVWVGILSNFYILFLVEDFF